MSVTNFEDLIAHKGHKIEVVTYGHESDPWNVAIECVTCSEVLVDFEKKEVEK